MNIDTAMRFHQQPRHVHQVPMHAYRQLSASMLRETKSIRFPRQFSVRSQQPFPQLNCMRNKQWLIALRGTAKPKDATFFPTSINLHQPLHCQPNHNLKLASTGWHILSNYANINPFSCGRAPGGWFWFWTSKRVLNNSVRFGHAHYVEIFQIILSTILQVHWREKDGINIIGPKKSH